MKCGINFQQQLCIVFVGEPAVDVGGPLREFLHLLMGEIAANNSLFLRRRALRAPVPNMAALQKLTFKHVGEMISVSPIHGGPPPTFLAQWTIMYMVQKRPKQQLMMYQAVL